MLGAYDSCNFRVFVINIHMVAARIYTAAAAAAAAGVTGTRNTKDWHAYF
jgi:hypothetical protein